MASASANKRRRDCSVGCAAAVLSSTLVICTAPISTPREEASARSTLSLFSSITSLVTPSRFICCLILAPPTSFAPPVMPVPAPVAEAVEIVLTFFPLLNAIPAPPVGGAIMGLAPLLLLSVAVSASCCSKSLGPVASLLSSSFVSTAASSLSAVASCGATAPNKKQDANSASNSKDTKCLLTFIVTI